MRRTRKCSARPRPWSQGAVGASRGEDAAASVVGVRQGHRERTLTVPSRINRTIGSSASERPFQASPCARSTGWQTLAEKPDDQIIDLAS